MINYSALKVLNDAAPLIQKYDRRLNAVAKASGNLTSHEQATTAILLDNTEAIFRNYKRNRNLSDATFSENVGPFMKHAMNLVSTIYSTFELKDLISIQPINQRIGAMYFLNYMYANNKGDVSAGDVALSPLHAPKRTGYYSSEEIMSEPVTGVYDDVAHTYKFNLQYYPVYTNKPLIIKITGGGTAVGNWQLVNGSLTNGTTTGTLVAANGAVTLTGVTAPVTEAVASYQWASETNRSLTPKINISVQEELVTATRRTLMFDVSLDATIDYENQFGRDLNAEVEASVLRHIQNELAYYVLGNIAAGADTSTVFDWDATRPDEISIMDHYQSLFKMLAEMSTHIYKNLGRGKGNKIVAGADFRQICDTLPDNYFKPTGSWEDQGPQKIGTLLNKYDVYFNPAYADDEFYMMYKGKDWWEAPYFIASYLPLMASKFMMFPDFHGEQGYISMEAHKYLFPNHVAKGRITA